MHCGFKDITEKLGVPEWYEVHGFPRYCKFDPDETMNIYADVAILYEIACQDCGDRFRVSESYTMYNIWDAEPFKEYMKKNNVGERDPLTPHIIPYFLSIKDDSLKGLHYGDPPRHDCYGAGETMNCNDIKILEFWVKNKSEWQRVPELEIELSDYETNPKP